VHREFSPLEEASRFIIEEDTLSFHSLPTITIVPTIIWLIIASFSTILKAPCQKKAFSRKVFKEPNWLLFPNFSLIPGKVLYQGLILRTQKILGFQRFFQIPFFSWLGDREILDPFSFL